ncbi:MAG: ABC transporter substrate-binding protein [Eubacteriales bacterium]|nr:ABC transporter substrate-binding protein [Eubacteriales bacterium]
MKKLLALLAAAVMLLSGIAAFAEGNTVLKIGAEAEPTGFDPHTTTQHVALRVIKQMYETLVDVDDNLNVIPMLAESWEQPDELTYVFKIRQGVKFHSGRELKAEDVKYSFERILDPNVGGLGSSESYAGNVEKIEVLDDYTVKFTLSKITAPFLASMSSIYCAIVDKDVVEQNGDLMRADGGTGPYTFVEWVPDNRVTLSKFKDYYKDGYAMETLEFYVLSDGSARMNALRTGEIDIMVGDSDMLVLANAAKNVDVYKIRTRDYVTLCLSLKKDEFKDVRVRQAISLALNRDEIIDLAFNGEAEVSGFIPASMGHWAVDVTEHPLYQQNIEKAKELMKEAGYENGFETVCTVGLLKGIINSGTVIQQQLAEIGIKVNIQNKENAQYIEDWKNHDFDLMVCQNGAGTDPNRGVGLFFKSGNTANIAEYSNARVDELIELGAGTTDVAQREEYYKEAINIILDECPNVTFASPYSYYFASSSLKGYAPTVDHPLELRNVTKE